MDRSSIEQYQLPHSNEITQRDDLSSEDLRILDIIRSALEHPPQGEFDELDLDQLLDILEKFDDQTCVVTRDEEGEIFAAANYRPEPDKEQLWVEHLAVDPDYQGGGTSRQFIDFFVMEATRQKLKRIGSRSLASAIHAHYAWGFQERPGDESEEMPVMYRHL